MNAPYYSGQMHYFRVLLPLAAAAFALLASACSGSKVIPPELEEQIDSSVSFRDIQASPQALQGRTVLLGGEVLGARRWCRTEWNWRSCNCPSRTMIRRPNGERNQRAGFSRSTAPLEIPRPFLLGQRSPSSEWSAGEETRRLDESSYRYPIVEVKHLYVWSEDAYRERSANSVGLFGGVGFGFGSGGRSGSFGGVGVGMGY